MGLFGTRAHSSLGTIGVIGYAFHLMATSFFGWNDSSTLIAGFGEYVVNYCSAFAATNWAAFFLGLVLCFFVLDTKSFRACVAASFLLSVVGWVLLWATSYMLDAGRVAILAGVCLGIANAIFFLLWQDAFSRMEGKTAQKSIVIGSGLAGVPVFVDLLMGNVSLSFLLISISLIGSGASLWILGGKLSWSNCFLRPRFSYNQGKALALALGSLWKGACCVAALGFVRGLLPSLVATYSDTVDSYQISLMLSTGRILSSAFLAVILFRLLSKGSVPNLETVYLVAFPAMATGFLLLPVADIRYQVVFMFLAYVIFALVSMLMMIDCLRESRRRGLHPMLVYGVYAGVIYGCTQAGSVFGDYSNGFGWQGLPWLFVLALLAIYIMALAFFVTRMRRTGKAGDAPAALDFDSGCVKLSDKYGLSPREREVLALLIKGRDLPRISKELFISENTTRSHLRNIYKKIGVHGKQEIIDLLENLSNE